MCGLDRQRGVTLLHLSDTQFGRYHRFGESDSLSRNLLYDLSGIREDLGVPPIDIVILSGDIAERGLPSEFKQARAFLDALCGALELELPRVVVVPGNHDVSWSACRSYFEECESYERNPEPPYARKWLHFQEFVTGLHGEASFTEEQPYRLEPVGKGVRCFRSSALSIRVTV